MRTLTFWALYQCETEKTNNWDERILLQFKVQQLPLLYVAVLGSC